jgi:ABC-type polysaccharide/polyol phosphate export permease
MSVPSVTPPNRTLQYFLGLGIGLIPLIVFFVAFGITLGSGSLNSLNIAIPLLLVSLLLYIIELIVTIIFLRREDVRFRGYGLLTAFLATPVIAFVGCTVIPNLVHR